MSRSRNESDPVSVRFFALGAMFAATRLPLPTQLLGDPREETEPPRDRAPRKK